MVLERLLEHQVHDLQVGGERVRRSRVASTRRIGHALAQRRHHLGRVDRPAHVQPSSAAGVAGGRQPAALAWSPANGEASIRVRSRPRSVGDRPALVVGPGVESGSHHVRLGTRRARARAPTTVRPAGAVLHRDPPAGPGRLGGRVTTSCRRVHDACPTTSDSTAASSTLRSPVHGERSASRRATSAGTSSCSGKRADPPGREGQRGRGVGHRERWRARAKQKRP